MLWRGELQVDLFNDQATTLALFPTSIALGDVRVDDRPASIVVQNDQFASTLRGKGAHRIAFEFQSPVDRSKGNPKTDLAIPAIPVSQFELTLPGNKDILVSTGSNVLKKESGGKTVATVNVPMTNRLTFSWSEAIPQEEKIELKANANIIHLASAEEGVLSVTAIAQYEITRGQSNLFEFSVPAGVQINRINSSIGKVADWRVVPLKDGSSFYK